MVRDGHYVNKTTLVFRVGAIYGPGSPYRSSLFSDDLLSTSCFYYLVYSSIYKYPLQLRAEGSVPHTVLFLSFERNSSNNRLWAHYISSYAHKFLVLREESQVE